MYSAAYMMGISCKFHTGVKIGISKGTAYLTLIRKTCENTLAASAARQEQGTGASEHSDMYLHISRQRQPLYFLLHSDSKY